MTLKIPVHLMFADSSPGGWQPLVQASWLGLWFHQ